MISWQEIVAKEAVSVCSHQYLLPQVNIGKTTRKVVFFSQLCKTGFWQGGMTSHRPLLASSCQLPAWFFLLRPGFDLTSATDQKKSPPA